MNEEILQRKEEFCLWLKTLYKDDGTTYGDTIISAYCYALEKACSKLKVSAPLEYVNVFCYDNIKSFNLVYSIIVSADNYTKVDLATGNRTFSSALLHYSNFLKSLVKNGKKSQSNADFIKWFNPIVISMRELGGSTTFEQLREKIISRFKIDELELSIKNGNDPNCISSNRFTTNISFALNYLVMAGIIDNSVPDKLTLITSAVATEIDDKLGLNIFNEGLLKIKSKANNIDVTKRYWLYPLNKMYKSATVFVSDSGVKSSNWAEFKENKIITIPFGELGDLRGYCSKEEMKPILRHCFGNNSDYVKTTNLAWQFANEMQIGDIIFVQEDNKILGRGIVTSDYGLDENREDNYNHTREVNWTNLGEWILPNLKNVSTITDISKYLGDINSINNALDYGIEELEDVKVNYKTYTKTDFLADVYIKDTEYQRVVNLLKSKKNIILQGPAGVGKTFMAKRLAYSILGEKNTARVKTIQFHQSYSYDDFFMGYRPTNNGLELKYGVFYNFCKQATLDSERDYFFIIDEINRSNLSKVFGELFMLIENDKRGEEIQLTYTDELFSIPSNLYIIGMMNTADRGLSMLDYALRRRFGFYEILPAFDSVGFMGYQAIVSNSKFNKLILEIKNLNKEIAFDENLGKGFLIGHSYFINNSVKIDSEWLQDVIDFEILSLLNEYWYDEPDKIEEWKNRLNDAIK